MESPDAVLFALKPAETGIADGVMARVWHLGEAEGRVTLRPDAQALGGARRVSHVEVDGEALPLVGGALVDTLPRQALRSYRLTFGDGPPPPPPPDMGVPAVDARPPEPVDADAAPGADARTPPEPDGGATPERDGGTTPERDAGTNPERDAGTTPERDAGTTPERDAGTNPERDAGTTPERDAGTPDARTADAANATASSGSAGCGCRTSGPASGAWLTGLLALGRLRRRPRDPRRCSAR